MVARSRGEVFSLNSKYFRLKKSGTNQNSIYKSGSNQKRSSDHVTKFGQSLEIYINLRLSTASWSELEPSGIRTRTSGDTRNWPEPIYKERTVLELELEIEPGEPG